MGGTARVRRRLPCHWKDRRYSREQAFNIIREWAKEFTEKYGNCDGSYYDAIDEFIDKKLGTI